MHDVVGSLLCLLDEYGSELDVQIRMVAQMHGAAQMKGRLHGFCPLQALSDDLAM